MDHQFVEALELTELDRLQLEYSVFTALTIINVCY